MSIIIETAKSERATERYEDHAYLWPYKARDQIKTEMSVDIMLEDYSNEL